MANVVPPLVSVVLPVYNGEKYIGEAIDSIFRQTFQDFELLVIDDGSTDGTKKILKKYSDKRLRVVRKTTNEGISRALNLGIIKSRGEYLARMDADDIATPDRLEKQVRFLDTHPDITIVGSWFKTFGAKVKIKKYPTDNWQIKLGLLLGSTLAHPTVMLRKKALIASCQFYDSHYDDVEDYDLWVRVAKKWKFANLGEILLFRREHGGNITLARKESVAKKTAIVRLRAWKNIFNNRESEFPVILDAGVAFEVNNWLLSRFVIKRLVPAVGYKPYPLNELMLMSGAVCKVRPECIFEWGTHRGVSARVFYETIKAFNIPCRIFSVDLPNGVPHPEHPGKFRGVMVKNISGVRLFRGDGLDVSMKLAQKETGKRLLFYLDGDHEYKTVFKELKTIRKYQPGAAIIIHDTFFHPNYNHGPYQAVRDFLALYRGEYHKVVADTGLPGMTFLFKK